MNNQILKFLFVAFSFSLFVSCSSEIDTKNYVKDNYTKKEVSIVMRDGVKLHTTIYTQKIQIKNTQY